jgi:hypothetical protein
VEQQRVVRILVLLKKKEKKGEKKIKKKGKTQQGKSPLCMEYNIINMVRVAGAEGSSAWEI